MDCSLTDSSVHGDSPGKNTGVGFHALLQGIFPTQGLNPGLLQCRQSLYCLSHQGSPSWAQPAWIQPTIFCWWAKHGDALKLDQTLRSTHKSLLLIVICPSCGHAGFFTGFSPAPHIPLQAHASVLLWNTCLTASLGIWPLHLRTKSKNLGPPSNISVTEDLGGLMNLSPSGSQEGERVKGRGGESDGRKSLPYREGSLKSLLVQQWVLRSWGKGDGDG